MPELARQKNSNLISILQTDADVNCLVMLESQPDLSENVMPKLSNAAVLALSDL